MGNIRQGVLIALEGLDGSGKTQLARELYRILHRVHRAHVMLTFEPHDPSAAGLFIRQVLTHRISVSPRTLAIAFALNRSDHNERVLRPFIEGQEGHIVLCDRYYLSSLVYQSGPNLSMAEVLSLNAQVLVPDITLFLRASASTCYARMRNRSENKELFETKLQDTDHKYSQAIELLRQRGERIVEIDAEPDFPEVLSEAVRVLRDNGISISEPLLPSESFEEFTMGGNREKGSQIDKVLGRLRKFTSAGMIMSERDLHEALDAIRKSAVDAIESARYDDIGAMFLDYLERLGYEVGQQPLAWTLQAAYELRYSNPMGIQIQGIALLLGEAKRYDLTTKAILELGQLSHFMVILDPRASQFVQAYSPESLYSRASETLVPTTRIIGRAEIARLLFTDLLWEFCDEYLITLRANSEMFDVVHEYVRTWGELSYWKRHVATGGVDSRSISGI